ncbi:MtrB/PioB family outer membrane beta-barrel protein, partial [Rhodanobacter lindaniclasticus]
MVGTPQVADIKDGQFSLEPDNDYHNIRLDLSRELKWNGQFTVAGAWGTMRQNDALLPPTTCTGVGGIFIAPPVNFTYQCANWNTTAALSRKSADARIATGLFDARVTFQAHARIRLGMPACAGIARTTRPATSPTTRSPASTATSPRTARKAAWCRARSSFFDPSNPLYWSSTVTVRNAPFGYTDSIFELGGDWQFGRKSSLGVVYTYDHNQPKYRER